ncbi:YniB family protein [Acinetobacter gerneri]|uniref:YniB family protein n=1 Tax=Acinetobacter gerneri TaxID=202952 RepID=A0AAW8JL86_9GAMM|nr:YniB family protein [Acinetobacter gerneri]MDQ9010301.1 YniB family protein [Acinetobacter gerneri]MDQ9014500.1 YniB family protein [Acinetobacter gerneri]MDQ9025671.1 YniB family protein [Acinetobacter gerneri]MDQ9052952.1 YniB family protein [Acinetobacter gerneri]MDQ9060610.1 YniB family protein [Acinetobacter gerneri]
MNYQTAKTKVIIYYSVGILLIILGFLFFLTGSLLTLYYSLENNIGVFKVTYLLKQMIYFLYEKTSFIKMIWNHAPILDPNHLSSKGSVTFIVWYVSIFFGWTFVRSANKLSSRLRVIDQDLEDQSIRASMRMSATNDSKRNIPIPNQSIWKEIHTLYIAPIVVGIVLWLISKLFS